MRHITNLVLGLIGAGTCGVMIWLSKESGNQTLIYNSAFLGAMIVIMLFGVLIGFIRMWKVRGALKRAIRQLDEITEGKLKVDVFGKRNETPFNLPYLDNKYKEYMSYVQRAGWEHDISDYIGEETIDTYCCTRVVELIPDFLTGLGILGTFIGLVWGLKDFNPESYEAMALTMPALIDGIKVAFITSIMGITLSMVFSYWLKGAQNATVAVLDKFLDEYYFCEGPVEISKAMSNLVENQQSQLEETKKLPVSISDAVNDKLSVSTEQLNKTMDRFVNIVTLNQQDLMENISMTITAAMVKQFSTEMDEFRKLLSETNRAQKEHLKYLSQAQDRYEDMLKVSSKRMNYTAEEEDARRREATEALKEHQKTLNDFTQAVGNMLITFEKMSEEDKRTRIEMSKQVETCQELTNEMKKSMNMINEETKEVILELHDAKKETVSIEVPEIKELSEKIDKLNTLLEEDKSKKKKGFFK